MTSSITTDAVLQNTPKCTALVEHIREWRKCRRCALSELCINHVLYRTVPKGARSVALLFIGEGPGEAEDAIGVPFIGPAGKLLQDAIDDAICEFGDINSLPPYGFTNLVACRPQDDGVWRNRAPSFEEIDACRPRLLEIVDLLNPAVAVLLGKVPQTYAVLPKGEGRVIIQTAHPSYILRCGGKRSDMYSGYVYRLREAFNLAASARDWGDTSGADGAKPTPIKPRSSATENVSNEQNPADSLEEESSKRRLLRRHFRPHR